MEDARREHREGWGMSSASVTRVVYPTSVDDVQAALKQARDNSWTVAFWGGGRSYGDAALNESNLLLDFSGMNRVIDFDPDSGEVVVEPGVTLVQLERFGLPKGFWPPVVSGTMFTTMGGCISANVHGKNNFKYGPWGDHVVRFTLVLTTGEVLEVDRESHADLFHHVIGGFGLLGVLVSITVKLKRVHSGRLSVLPSLAEDLDEMFRQFERFNDSEFDYVVGWIDAFAGGISLGRGQIHAARYVEENEDPEGKHLVGLEHQQLPDRFFVFIPKSWLWWLARPWAFRWGMQLINSVRFWFMKFAGHHEPRLETHTAFNHLLDFVPNWKWFYTPGGLIQYQFFLPKEVARPIIRQVLELCRSVKLESWLVVMKRHRADDFPLSHAVDGYSFAMDFPVTDKNRGELYRLTERFNELVVEAGGRFYFAKDSVVTSDAWRKSLGDEVVGRFLALKAKYDPDEILGGNLYRRVIKPLKGEVKLLEPKLPELEPAPVPEPEAIPVEEPAAKEELVEAEEPQAEAPPEAEPDSDDAAKTDAGEAS